MRDERALEPDEAQRLGKSQQQQGPDDIADPARAAADEERRPQEKNGLQIE